MRRRLCQTSGRTPGRRRAPPPPLWGRIEEGGHAEPSTLASAPARLIDRRDPPPCPAPTRGAGTQLVAPSPTGGDGRTAVVVIDDPHGLHARPAARLVAAASAIGARVTIADLDNGKGPAVATSLVALGALGARRGHRLQIVAHGPDADEAVAALASLVRSFHESAGDGVPAAAAARSSGRAIPVSPGVAIGPLRRLEAQRPDVPETRIEDPAPEIERLRQGLRRTREAILLDAGSASRSQDIVAIQNLMLNDPELVGEAERLIREERDNAALALRRAGDRIAAIYAGLDDPVLRARESDVRDAVGAALRTLLDLPPLRLPTGEPAVYLASDLPPSLAHALDPEHVLGVVDRRGGPTSHAAILLRGLGIPAVAGAEALVPDKAENVAFDGSTGEIAFDPPADALAAFRTRARAHAEMARSAALVDGAVTTADGVTIEIWANAAGLRDARAARQAGVSGIGLLRTEAMFLDRRDAPSEEEQSAALREIFVAARSPVVVRTLDAGGDKPIPYMNMPKEANPFLGLRGLRLSLEEIAIFETQLRAILVAGLGFAVQIMLPMVTDRDEVEEARGALLRAHVALETRGVAHLWPAPLGIMIETPAAALEAERLAEVADFFSIGTNDLTQYTLAAERGHPRLGRFADASHPAVLELVRRVAEVGRAKGVHVAVCGEAAGDPAAAVRLVGAGVRALSMSPALIPRVARALREARSA